MISIALGSNIAPEKNLKAAAHLLRQEFPDIRFSSVYKTAPREVMDQPIFLNAVASAQTDLDPEDVATKLRDIERTLKKDVAYRFGPRTIDLDLLLYDDVTLETPKLQIPHPRMQERRFVLEPLSELIDVSQKHPVLQKSWEELLANTMDQECEKTQITL